jgi:hypothetical protein
MRRIATTFAIAGATLIAAVAPSLAECAKFGFTVNDYGKEGPTKDAQDLLDKTISKWATDNKVKKYQVSKKETTCELFLNFIVFDEHTCKAEALVCIDGKMPSNVDAVPLPKGTQMTTVVMPPEKASPVQTGSVPKKSDAVAKASTAPAPKPVAAPKAVPAPKVE